MVKFTSDNVRPVDAPSFLSYSRGRVADTAGPRAIGSFVETAFTAADNAENKAIKEEIDATVQKENENIFSLLGDNAPQLPVPLKQGIKDAQRLSTALKQGKISSTAYWAKLQTKAQELREKYPNKKDFIDQTFSSLTGNKPANALRRSLLSELASQQQSISQEASREETFIRKAAADGAADPKTVDLYLSTSDPAKKKEIESHIIKNYSLIGTMKAEKSRLEYLTKKDKVDTLAVSKAADKLSSSFMAKAISDGFAFGTGVYSARGLQQTLGKATSDGRITPDEMKAIQTYALQFKSAITNGLQNLYYGKNLDNGKVSIAEKLGPEETRKRIENQLKVLDETLFNNIQSGKLDAATLNAGLIEAMTTNDQLDLMTDPNFGSVSRSLSTIKEAFGDSAVGVALTSDPSLLGNITKSFIESKRSKTSVLSNLTSDAKQNKVIIDSAIAVATTDDNNKRDVNLLFGDPEALTKVEPKARPAVYNKMFGGNLLKNFDSFSVEEKKTVYESATRNFQFVFKSVIDDLNNLQDSENFKITYDPSKGVFSFTSNPGDVTQYLGVLGAAKALTQIPDTFRFSRAKESIDNLNIALKNYKELSKKMGLEDPMKAVNSILSNTGFILKAQGSEDKQGLIEGFMQKAFDFIDAIPESEPKTAKGSLNVKDVRNFVDSNIKSPDDAKAYLAEPVLKQGTLPIEDAEKQAIPILLDSIKSWEGFEPSPSDDGFGNLTVGYGHKVRKGENFGPQEPISDLVATDILKKDVSEAIKRVKAIVNPNVKLTPVQFAAITDLFFNSSVKDSSRFVKALKEGDLKKAFKEYDFYFAKDSKGKTSKSLGLARRRAYWLELLKREAEGS